MTTLTVAERVANGAAWLDSWNPGWVDQIDLRSLNLASSCHCVLGQTEGWDRLRLRDPYRLTMSACSYGFLTRYDDRTGGYPALQREWERVILARRAGAAAVAVAETEPEPEPVPDPEPEPVPDPEPEPEPELALV